MPANFFDAVVLGGDLAATVAAALLAQRGLRVLLTGGAGGAEAVEERYTIGSYVLPRAPLAFVGLDSPALKRLTAELNLVQVLRRKLDQNRPAFQLLLPDARLDVGDDLERELQREAPDAAAATDAALARLGEVSTALEGVLAEDVALPPDGFWDRRDTQRVAQRLPGPAEDVLAPLPLGHPLRTLATLPAVFAGDLAWSADGGVPGPLALARLADLHRRGTWRLDGGANALRTLLHERLQAHSGEVRAGARPVRFLTKRGRVVGVVLERAGKIEEVGCEQVVAGVSAARLVELLDGEKPGKRLAEAAQMAAPLHRYLLHLVAPLDALPDALGRLAFSVVAAGAPLHGPQALRLHLADGYGQHAVLSVEALASDPSPAGLAALRAGVRRHLDRLFPFLDRHLLLVHSPHDGVAPEGPGGAPLAAAAPPPLAPEPLWQPVEPLLGLCGVPHASGVKHLTLASRQVLPGLGLEGELVTGWTVARLLASDKKRDLGKGAVLSGG